MPDRVRERWSCGTHLHACSFDFVRERKEEPLLSSVFLFAMHTCNHGARGPWIFCTELNRRCTHYCCMRCRPAIGSKGVGREASVFLSSGRCLLLIGHTSDRRLLSYLCSCCTAVWHWMPNVETMGPTRQRKGRSRSACVLVPLDQVACREGLVGWPVKPVPLPSLSPNSLILLLCSYSQEHSREEKLSSSPLSLLWFEPQSSESQL